MLGVSQEEFAQMLDLSPAILKEREAGRNLPGLGEEQTIRHQLAMF